MEVKIFQGWFRMYFRNEEIEKDFQKEKLRNLFSYNKIIMTCLFITSALDAIMNSFFLQHFDILMFRTIFISSYINAFIFFVFLFVSLCSKNSCAIRYVHYFTYYLIWMISVNFRYTINHITNTEVLVLIFITVEISLRLTWVILGLHGFLESLLLNCLSIISMWILYPTIFDETIRTEGVLNILTYSFTLIVVIFFSYLFVRRERKAFYFHWMADKERKWLTNVFENMMTGFLSVKNGSIVYVNNYLLKQIEKYRNNINTNKNSVINTNQILLTTEGVNLFVREENYDKGDTFNSSDVREILKSILTNIKTDSINNQVVNKAITDFKNEIVSENCPNSNESFLKIFAKHVSLIEGIENFKLIGENSIEVEENEFSFELHCRYFKSEQNEDEIEFLFNDVTRTKIKEKQNAEFKYKTLFLSKVAHEFKNPLICITELINEINENYSHKAHKEKENDNSKDNIYLSNLSQIKSLSNFLIILVRDLNYFTESQMGKDADFNLKQEDLKEIVTFVKEVTKSLIKKCNKSEAIEFTVHVDKKVPDKLMTDQWRLKQVLINLLSNSVKFTLYGQIILEIYLEKRDEQTFVKFLVKDTGTGIKEEQQKRLFLPYKEFTSTNNEIGSGLGLYIANEIAGKIGEKISFSSEYERGSSFWFYIPLIDLLIDKDNNSISECSENNNSESISSYTSGQNVVRNKYSENSMSNKTNLNDTLQIDYNPTKCRKTLIDISEIKCDNLKIKNIPQSLADVINLKSNSNYHPNNKNLFSLKSNDNSNKYSIHDFLVNDVSNLRRLESTPLCDIYNKTRSSNFLPNKEILIKNDFINVIVVDDEKMIRQSTIGILERVARELKININIIEAEDGVECIYLVYKASTKGIKISMIFSDENMIFLNGSQSSNIIKEILQKKNINHIPFYLVTAYDNSLIEHYVGPSIKRILSKPLSKEITKKIIYEYLKK